MSPPPDLHCENSLAELLFDLAHADQATRDAASDVLAAIAANYRSRRDAAVEPVEQVELLRRIIYGECGMTFGGTPAGANFLLSDTLIQRRGTCLGLTSIYLVAAQRLCLPLRALLYDGHITACYPMPPRYLHVEVSRGGRIMPASVAQSMFMGRGVPRVLSTTQFVAVYAAQCAAFVVHPRNGARAALCMTDRAIRSFPDFVPARINRVALLSRLGEYGLARQELRRLQLLDLSPTLTRMLRPVAESCPKPSEHGDMTEAVAPLGHDRSR